MNRASSAELWAGAEQTRLRLERMTDRSAFQALCDEVLSAHFGYRVRPRGLSDHGTVKGQPDSWAHDEQGRLCALAYSTSRNWRSKLAEDLAAVAVLAQAGFSPEVFVFCTNRHVDASIERDLAQEVRRRYGWELRLFGQGDLALPLDTSWQDIRRRHLHVQITHHNWSSLLAACRAQRQAVLARYAGKYDSTLYVARRTEQTVDRWYRQSIDAMAKGPVRAQLLMLVDGAGAGKSNVVLHLAERYGRAGPVLIFPGSVTMTDDHSLEREVATAIGYAIDARSYQADMDHILRLAEKEGLPLLIVLDGVNENREPHRIRGAVTQLLTAHRGRPLLVLITCRDSLWVHLQDPLWRSFAYRPEEKDSDEIAVQLGAFDDNEFTAACSRYFTTYGVSANLGPDAARVLRSPLLLRMFAEVSAGRVLGHVPTVALGQLWEQYWNLKLQDVDDGLGRRLRQAAIATTLEALALRMIEQDSPVLARPEIAGLPHLGPDDASGTSLLVRLVDAAVLMINPDDSIRLLYDAFFDFVAGRALARRLDDSSSRTLVLARVEQLSSDHRWADIPIHVAARAADPDVVIDRILQCNLWLAARALRRVESRVSAAIRARVARELLDRLTGRYALDRARAATALGWLGISEAVPTLLRQAREDRSAAATQALVCLGCIDAVEPVIEYLGRHHPFYLPRDQALLDTAPEPFRVALAERALALLDEPEWTLAATRTLGYLRSAAAIAPIADHLAVVDGQDAAALVALLRIGTSSALGALEYAMGLAGALARAYRQAARAAEAAGDPATAKENDDRAGRAQFVMTDLRLYGLHDSSLQVVVPFFMRLLQNQSFDVRLTAIQSLAQLGAVSTAPTIVQSATLAAKEFGTSIAIYDALRAFGTRLDPVPFLEMLNTADTPEVVQGFAVEALGHTRDPRSYEVLAHLIADRRLMLQAVQALGRLGDPAAVSILTPLLDAKDIDRNRRVQVVGELGRLRHPSAFPALERYLLKCQFEPAISMIEAVAATGRDRALPIFREFWLRNSSLQEHIAKALVWMSTPAATTTLLELLEPLDAERMGLLVKAVGREEGLFFIGVPRHSPVDERVLSLIDLWFDQLPPATQRAAVWALERANSPASLRVIERVARDPNHAAPLPELDNGPTRSIRDWALQSLSHMGSPVAIEAVLVELVHDRLGVATHYLSRMSRPAVVDALRRNLGTATGDSLVSLLRLLGWFGDANVLSDVRPFLDDLDMRIADAAYEAEQRILGAADVE